MDRIQTCTANGDLIVEQLLGKATRRLWKLEFSVTAAFSRILYPAQVGSFFGTAPRPDIDYMDVNPAMQV